MVKVLVDLEEMDLDTLATIEDVAKAKAMSIASMKEIVAGFLVADDGTALPRADALAYVGRMKLREVKDVIEQLGVKFKRVKEEAVPLAMNATSLPPSTTEASAPGGSPSS